VESTETPSPPASTNLTPNNPEQPKNTEPNNPNIKTPKPQSPPKTTPSKKNVKIIINPYTDIVEAFIAKSNIILQNKKEFTDEECVELQNLKKEAGELRDKIENYSETIWEKKEELKEKCDDCEALILSSRKLCAQIDKLKSRIVNALKKVNDNVVTAWKNEYWAVVLQTVPDDMTALSEIKTEIDKKRNQHSLWAWIGINKIKNRLNEVENNYQKINTESDLFIAQKQEQYEDDNDKEAIADLKNEIPYMYNDIRYYKDSLSCIKTPYGKLSAIGVLLLLLITGIIFYARVILRNRRIEKKEQEKKDAGESGLLIEDDDIEEVVLYSVGLSDVKEKAGTDYYKIDMLSISKDTSIRNVYFSRKAILEVYQFFSDFSKYNSKINETGCFLVGRWEYVPHSHQQMYDISIESIVEPSDDAVYGEYNLNFGAKIGITLNYAIENLCQKTGNEYVHTAWMHSHPGLGLFLSIQDLSVQSQLAHSQHQGRMLAIVLDSNTPDWQTAFFAPKQDNTMNNDKDLKQTLSLETLYQWAKTE